MFPFAVPSDWLPPCLVSFGSCYWLVHYTKTDQKSSTCLPPWQSLLIPLRSSLYFLPKHPWFWNCALVVAKKEWTYPQSIAPKQAITVDWNRRIESASSRTLVMLKNTMINLKKEQKNGYILPFHPLCLLLFEILVFIVRFFYFNLNKRPFVLQWKKEMITTSVCCPYLWKYLCTLQFFEQIFDCLLFNLRFLHQLLSILTIFLKIFLKPICPLQVDTAHDNSWSSDIQKIACSRGSYERVHNACPICSDKIQDVPLYSSRVPHAYVSIHYQTTRCPWINVNMIINSEKL